MCQQLIANGHYECDAEDNATDQQIGEEKCHIIQVALSRCDSQKLHDTAALLFDHWHKNHVEQRRKTVNNHHKYFRLFDANKLSPIACIQREFLELQLFLDERKFKWFNLKF